MQHVGLIKETCEAHSSAPIFFSFAQWMNGSTSGAPNVIKDFFNAWDSLPCLEKRYFKICRISTHDQLQYQSTINVTKASFMCIAPIV